MKVQIYISFSDRKQIAALYLSNTRPADIAEKIGVSAAAVYRELKRGETAGDDGAPVLDQNQRRAYNPVVAQQTVQASFRRRGRTAAEDEQGGATVTQFEQITKSPETLGAFLAALPVVNGPWDEEFHARFCAGCAATDCDACLHAAERNNPCWWLNLDSGDGGDADRFAVIVTYHTGAMTGAVVEAESAGAAWRKVFTIFSPEIIASATVSRILTPERGSTE